MVGGCWILVIKQHYSRLGGFLTLLIIVWYRYSTWLYIRNGSHSNGIKQMWEQEKLFFYSKSSKLVFIHVLQQPDIIRSDPVGKWVESEEREKLQKERASGRGIERTGKLWRETWRERRREEGGVRREEGGGEGERRKTDKCIILTIISQ